MSRGFLVTAAILLSFALSSGVALAQDAAMDAPLKIPKPEIVYVRDFMLLSDNVTQPHRGPVRSLLREARDTLDDPDQKADQITGDLSQGLVDGLNNKGITAMRYNANSEDPARGWMIEGEFLQFDEGDNLRRATIGLGAGESKMHIKATVRDLAHPSDGPFIVFDPKASSGKMPGGAAAMIIAKNPYVMAAKLVLSPHAQNKEIKKLASQIADELYKYMQAGAAGAD